MTSFSTKREQDLELRDVQSGNKQWWTDHTMSYDWKDQIRQERYSLPWFDECDRSFIQAAHLFATREIPFDRVIPFEKLRGKSVLEIGCGMGLHTELFARAGCVVTTIDISPTSIEATGRRLELKGLDARLINGDAEQLPFDSGSFDFVWSWGVIHHSSRTTKIVREIARVLKADGSCRVMVYSRASVATWLAALQYCVLHPWAARKKNVEEILYASTDGFQARFYVPEHFADIFAGFFKDVNYSLVGQESDVVPLPRMLRRLVLPFLSLERKQRIMKKFGTFIFLEATSPF